MPTINPENVTCEWYIGYKHMSRFHAKMVYLEEIFKGFDYSWRFDDDSALRGPVKYDVFKFMQVRPKLNPFYNG